LIERLRTPSTDSGQSGHSMLPQHQKQGDTVESRRQSLLDSSEFYCNLFVERNYCNISSVLFSMTAEQCLMQLWH